MQNLRERHEEGCRFGLLDMKAFVPSQKFNMQEAKLQLPGHECKSSPLLKRGAHGRVGGLKGQGRVLRLRLPKERF